ncbi:MAG: glycosyltransferase family 39 protein [Kofleriaceae bacterium]|nr:glycosyltransferase family 39 protein [Kofleriaceae bacterium]MBP9166964.1 glycosyltransferase family 39 protein [Kofleriaceae bacterium]MBP9858275.1 glycosyltransferase family 39 protein [Kofleriaceae bacterium]
MTARGLRRLTAAALCALTMAVALWSQRDVGLARDELVYMGAGDGYARWWIDAVDDWGAATSKAKITAAFGGPGPTDHNREHPPLMKTLFGFSKRLLHDRLEVASPTTAYRAPSALLHGILIAIVFLWAAAVWGFAEGLIAALLTLALPRALFHAGLAAFDGPIATLWVATLYCYWRALASWRWAPIAGVVWGLALATKHNALLLPLVIAPHFVWVVAADAVTRARAMPGRGAAALGRALLARLYLPPALIVLGPLTLFALWPWLWLDPIDHVRAWLEFHLRHVHYNFEYLGENWNHPPFPWHVALVTTALTVPAATLAAAALGLGVRVRGWWSTPAAARAGDPALLLALSVAASMGPFFLGSTPIFGAEKHWEAAIPSLCVAAGIGVVWAARRAAAGLGQRWSTVRAGVLEVAAIAVVGGAVVASAGAETLHARPYALTSYNAVAGGAPGGADLGMNRQFWGYAARGVLAFLASQPPGRVYSHDASPAWGAYQRDRLLPPGRGDAGPEDAGVAASRYALVIHERHFNRHDYMIWASYGTVAPVFVLRHDGVPIVSVYRRPER